MNAQLFFQSLYQQFHLDKREIDLIICHALNINTAALFIFDKNISNTQQTYIKSLLKQRSDGKPYAYITGFKEFWNLTLKVNEHTLIPRPETELIIELILMWTDKDYTGKILDLGTGTGAIALSIASERPSSRVTAIDYSPECVEIATYNKNKYNLSHVEILQSNWFGNIMSNDYDFIVSNPPYIIENDPHLNDLKYEPISALTAEDNGLKDIKTIILQAKKHLKNEGKILLEHGYNQKNDVQSLLNYHGYTNIETHNDLAQIPRVTSAKYMS